MTGEGDMREMLGRVLNMQETQGRQIEKLDRKFEKLDDKFGKAIEKVTFHRAAGVILSWLLTLAIAAFAAFKGFGWHR